MTEENKNLENLARYQYADVSARLYSNEQTAPFAKGALEKLIEKMDSSSKDIAEGFYKGAFATEEGMKIAISINAKKYQDALNGLNVAEFYEARLGTLKSVLGDEKTEEAKSIFEKYSGQTIGSINKKFEQANAILKDKTGLFDDKKKDEAKKTIEKLTPLYTLINLIEQRNYETLIPSATKSTYKEEITEALKKLA
ncbi:Uncharacterised protein [uncultured archaeon]|nr:Uncharacterised protein [uncultured archaeon]